MTGIIKKKLADTEINDKKARVIYACPQWACVLTITMTCPFPW